MTLHTEPIAEPNTGRYCGICDEEWHEPYAHKSGEFWHVPASSGAYYLVRGTACGCPSFYFGKRPCKHITKVNTLEALGYKHDLAFATWVRYEQARWPEDPTLDDIRGSIS